MASDGDKQSKPMKAALCAFLNEVSKERGFENMKELQAYLIESDFSAPAIEKNLIFLYDWLIQHNNEAKTSRLTSSFGQGEEPPSPPASHPSTSPKVIANEGKGSEVTSPQGEHQPVGMDMDSVDEQGPLPVFFHTINRLTGNSDFFTVASEYRVGPNCIIQESASDLGLDPTIGVSHELRWYIQENGKNSRTTQSTFVVVAKETIDGNIAFGTKPDTRQRRDSDHPVPPPSRSQHDGTFTVGDVNNWLSHTQLDGASQQTESSSDAIQAVERIVDSAVKGVVKIATSRQSAPPQQLQIMLPQRPQPQLQERRSPP